MASLFNLVLILTIFVFPFGQLLRIRLANIEFPLFDISFFLLAFFNFLRHLQRQTKPLCQHFSAFLIYALFSLCFNLWLLKLTPFKPFFYFLRLASGLSFFIFPPILPKIFPKIIKLSLLSTVVFGLVQYFLWPDFTFMKSLGWDPHLNRLVGSFFDPTFTGLIFLLFFLSLLLSPKLLFTDYLLLVTCYLSLALTYSRSSYLSLLVCSFYLSRHRHNWKIFIFFLALVATTWVVLPTRPGEGNNLYRTSSIRAKIENYRQGLSLFVTSPIIGCGYNTLGFLRQNPSNTSHHLFGFDSSLLTIAVTTGSIGLILFLLGIRNLFLFLTFPRRLLLIAVLAHSLFANSFLYPWTLFLLAFL